MTDLSTWGTVVLGSGGLITSGLALYYARSTKLKTESEAGVNEASAKEIEEKAATLSDERYRKREEFWRTEVKQVKDECHEEIDELREEIAWLKMLIEQHVPWDWEQQRKLTMANIDHEKPPTLNYIRGKHTKD